MYRHLYQLMRLANPREFLTIRYTSEFERDQWLSLEEIQRISWQKLKNLLEHSYTHVPFYRQRFQAIGLTPQDIQTAADFRRIPLLSKDDIRQSTELMLVTNYDREKMTRTTTSGSTGVPLALYRERKYDCVDVAAFTRLRHWFECEPGDKIAWFWGSRGSISNLTLKQRLKRERWLNANYLTSEDLKTFAEKLRRWRPHIIAGYTNIIYLFATCLTEQKIGDIHPRFVETTATPTWPHERELLEQVFQCPVSDRYSSHEAGAVISAECPLGSKHVFHDFCYVEIIKDGRLALPGEMGEVVITPLYAFGMPLIRYRMEDIATWTDTPCDCGRGLPILGELVGRTTNIFTLPSGKLIYGGAFRRLALNDIAAIEKFKVHQHAKDSIEIILQIGENSDESISELVRKRCMELLAGEPVSLTITVTDKIPSTTAGKFLVTTSDVPVSFN